MVGFVWCLKLWNGWSYGSGKSGISCDKLENAATATVLIMNMEKESLLFGIWSLALANDGFKPDFKFHSLSVIFLESVSKTGIFKLVTTYPTFSPTIWPSIPEFYIPNKTYHLLL